MESWPPPCCSAWYSTRQPAGGGQTPQLDTFSSTTEPAKLGRRSSTELSSGQSRSLTVGRIALRRSEPPVTSADREYEDSEEASKSQLLKAVDRISTEVATRAKRDPDPPIRRARPVVVNGENTECHHARDGRDECRREGNGRHGPCEVDRSGPDRAHVAPADQNMVRQ